jgi:hypothetical protein
MDKFSVYALELGDDISVYNILPLNVSTAQVDGTLDKGKLNTFLSDIKTRLKILNNDFQMIKGVFLEGKEPITLGKVNLEVMAETNPPEESNQIVYKYSTTTGVQTTPQQTTAELTNTTSTKLAQQNQTLTEQIQTTGQRLQRDLTNTQNELAETQKKLTQK